MILIFHFQAVGDHIEYKEQRSFNNSLSHLFGMISSTFLLQQFFCLSSGNITRKILNSKAKMTRNKILQEGSATSWDDVVFIPPGFDVSTTPAKQ